MREYDALCLEAVPDYSSGNIRALRKRYNLSQAVLASVLNTSLSTIRQWEIGEKHPSGSSPKLLNLLDRQHDRRSLDCGISALNDYLARFARQHQDSGISRTFVAVDEQEPTRIVGYYSLSAGGIGRSCLPASAAKRFPQFPIPVGRLARLAVDLKARGRGLGEHLLMDALHRFFRTGDRIGMAAIVVDAKDEQARRFCRRYNFESLPDQPLTPWLPMKSVERLFRGK